jgi:hypothetical protein
LPFFDSPSVFGAILDDEKGGRFQRPTRDKPSRCMYLPDTNVLLTRFLSSDGVGEVLYASGSIHCSCQTINDTIQGRFVSLNA